MLKQFLCQEGALFATCKGFHTDCRARQSCFLLALTSTWDPTHQLSLLPLVSNLRS